MSTNGVTPGSRQRHLRWRAATASAATVVLAVLAMVVSPTAHAQETSDPQAETQDAESDILQGILQTIPGLDKIDVQFENLSIEPDGSFLFAGYVDIRLEAQRLRLQADEVRVTADYAFEASGNVVFDQGTLRLAGEFMRGDMDDGTGVIEDAVGVGPGPMYFRARRIRQERAGLFRVEGGVVTPCRQATPIWEFRASKMTLEPGDHVSMTLPTFRVKGIPIFAFPYLYWPLQDDSRQTGFLLPSMGSSQIKGFMFSETFFWAVNRSLDSAFTYEHFAKAGNGYGLELRHAFGENARGSVHIYHLQGLIPTDEQLQQGLKEIPSGWSVRGSHAQALPLGFNLRANADYVTSTAFTQVFRDDFDRRLQRSSQWGVGLSKTWGASDLSINVSERRNFISSTVSQVGQKTPDVRFRVRPTQVAGPLYVSLQASGARLASLERTERGEGRDDKVIGAPYGRFDAYPEVALQLTQIPWISFSPFFRWRSTYYTHRQGKQDFRVLENPILRNYYETGITVVGPSLFRIVDTPSSEYSPALKHVIEPRVTYIRRTELERDDPGVIIRYDEIDSAGGDDNSMIATLTSRLFAKRYLNPNDEQRQIWELATISLSRRFDYRDGRAEQVRPAVPLPYQLSVRVRPSNRIDVDVKSDFTHQFRPGTIRVSTQLALHSLITRISWSRSGSTFVDFDDPTIYDVTVRSSLLGGTATLSLFDDRLTLRGGANLDALNGEVLQWDGAVTVNTQCCSIGGQVRKYNFQSRDDFQFSVILALSQVGQFGFGSERR